MGHGRAGGADAPGASGTATDADRRWLRAAAALSHRCPPSRTAFSVGAVVVAADGGQLGAGYSRRDDPHDHAEEVALRAVDPADPRLAGATLYSSLEPCAARSSRPRPCADLVLDTPIPRVVFAWREPTLFVAGGGADRLRAAGRTAVEVPELAEEARAANAHLLD